MTLGSIQCAVVPGYYLVCYNVHNSHTTVDAAVVPGYYLVCYNSDCAGSIYQIAVVPGYYLVCYNICTQFDCITHSCSSRLLLGML